ncbi:hypothetical protein [Kaistella antarctica]|uniref:Uncharacterized protein n=1 Tax=Kaistella antarctica TaxID=266748 RepID=A0A3S4VBS2_9FLAO|nr:hypothetical protein [Kaistella antarctica]KEY19916.1 hypothetical protein HY04_01455 [Kaistella antarctica]SEV95933.1 hypothetical protein SAMN05421765_1482 [Kaistella antarctica]VEH96103.1 Uncharacterised protein [Kaistella antarctica]
MLNFPIKSNRIISNHFLELGLNDFKSAAEYIQFLPYKRNSVKENELCVFKDLGGTCSTKHSLLKNLAIENHFSQLKLMLGIFMMNENNTPKMTEVLKKYGLRELPEAHNYLKYKNEIFDFTRKNFSPENFINDLIEEIEIQPSQITDFKVAYHRNFLINYLKDNPNIPYSLEDFWKIREKCIFVLQQ